MYFHVFKSPEDLDFDFKHQLRRLESLRNRLTRIKLATKEWEKLTM